MGSHAPIEAPSTMRAAFYDQVGAARDILTLQDVPTPSPAAGELRVRVQWSGVNPSDVKSRGGLRTKVMPFPRVTPHSDGMGVVESVGAGVDASRVGQRVWLWNAAWGRPFGTAAEYVCLPEKQAVNLPENVSGEAGACMGIPALTAMHAVLMDGGVAGKTVLVPGGAGAVGHYALQLASRLGAAHVITTVSNEAKAQLARAAGADAVVNYKDEAVVERIMALTQGKGVDRVIELDMANNAAINIEVLKPGGEMVVYGSSASPMSLPFGPLITKNIALKFFMVYHLADGDRARAEGALQRMLRRDELVHNIAARMTLAQIVEAHEMVEQGRAMGNVVLRVGQT
jgi:NADPH:quinone reductase